MTVYRIQGEAGKRLESALANLEKKVAKVGWFEGSKYPSKAGRAAVPVAYVAAIHEKGYPEANIPARPFIAPTIRNKQNEWADIAERGSRAILRGTETIDTVLEKIGRKAVGDIQKTISLLSSPPLKPATIAARLRARGVKRPTLLVKKKLSGVPLSKTENRSFGLLDKPLVDTRHMLNTLIHKVEGS